MKITIKEVITDTLAFVLMWVVIFFVLGYAPI